MEKFLALSEEKQKKIIEAGFYCFGKMGYKKASAQDIAQMAGISKGMIFHYFGSKKDMYRYLIEISFAEVMEAFKTGADSSKTDFFDRILMMTNCKIDCLKKHPSLLSFFTSMYSETDPEVFDETEKIRITGKSVRGGFVSLEADREKFKDPSYADLAWKLLMSYGESYANTVEASVAELSLAQKEFSDCVLMLKKNLYKEEYC